MPDRPTQLHCWMTNVGEAERRFGRGSLQWVEALNRPCTCMLPRDHRGPHKWTFDGNVLITPGRVQYKRGF